MPSLQTRDDRSRVRALLAEAGVAGAEDFGRFVNDRRYFDASGFDARAATAVLVQALPSLSDPAVIAAAALHLKNPAARSSAFEALHRAFLIWGEPTHGHLGWQLGDALVNAAPLSALPELLAIVTDGRYGSNRQQIVLGLPRFRRSPDTEATLQLLIHEPDVAQQAMYALRRVAGPQRTIDALEGVRREHPDTVLERQARHEIRKIERTIRRQGEQRA